MRRTNFSFKKEEAQLFNTEKESTTRRPDNNHNVYFTLPPSGQDGYLRFHAGHIDERTKCLCEDSC